MLSNTVGVPLTILTNNLLNEAFANVILFTIVPFVAFDTVPVTVEFKICAVTVVSNNGAASRKLHPSIVTVCPFMVFVAVLFEKLQEYKPSTGLDSIIRVPELFLKSQFTMMMSSKIMLI